MLHTEVDLGSAAKDLREALRRDRRPGEPDPWQQRQALLRDMWRGIAQRLDELDLPAQSTRVYQDGLPVCGKEEAIVRELAERGSLNHRLIVALSRRGATLMGTEDGELLRAEYDRLQKLKQLLAAERAGAPEGPTDALMHELRREGDSLLLRRDAFIVQRIEDTLQEGETGVVFLGLLHRVDEAFVGRCDLRLIIHNLPFWSDRTRELRERLRHG